MRNQKLKDNPLRSGLTANRKIKPSFYRLLFRYHIDWALFITYVVSSLAVAGSSLRLFFVIKVFLFLVLMFLSIKYLLTWKELQLYNELKDKAFKVPRKLIDNNQLKSLKSEELGDFKLDTEVAGLNLYDEFLRRNNQAQSFDEFLQARPDAANDLLQILNKDIKKTSTIFGLAIGMTMLMAHLRTIPRIELTNYRRLIVASLLFLLFLVIHAIEITFNDYFLQKPIMNLNF